MKLVDFKDLNELDQIKIVREKSVRLAKRWEGVYRFVLYQVDSFYVELKYFGETQAVHGMKAIDTTSKIIDKYLGIVDLSEIKK